MRKQFTQTIKNILNANTDTSLLLGDIGVFGFREEIKNLPRRVFNIGILEQCTIGVAAGMSKIGMIPIVHTIAPFLVERSFEQLKIDFGYQNLNGNFISVGASYDYSALGCTHHCPGDVGVLSTIPNMQILIPGTSSELNTLLLETYNNGSPTYTRLSERENKTNQDVTFGKGIVIKIGKQATVVCFGNMLSTVTEACKDLDVTILYYTTIVPFDSTLLRNNFNTKVIICEQFYEGSVNHLITNALNGCLYQIYNISIPRKFIHNYGTREEIDEHLGLNIDGINKKIKLCLI